MSVDSKAVAVPQTAAMTEAQVKVNLAALANIADDDAQWAEVAPDFGETVVFQNVGDSFVGMLAGKKIVQQPQLDDKGEPQFTTDSTGTAIPVMRDVNVYECMGTDGERYSLWGSYSIDLKLGDLAIGTPFRIEYKGERDFTSDAGQPRRVRSFKVSIPVSGQTR